MQRKYLFIHHMTEKTYSGQRQLDMLQELCEPLTACAFELRKEGKTNVSMRQIISRYNIHRPNDSFVKANESMFTYTGKRVIVNEKNFMAWYEGTDEGAQVRADNIQNAPGFGNVRFCSIMPPDRRR